MFVVLIVIAVTSVKGSSMISNADVLSFWLLIYMTLRGILSGVVFGSISVHDLCISDDLWKSDQYCS